MRKDDLWKCCFSCGYYKPCTSYVSPLGIENCDKCLARDELLAYEYAVREHSCYIPHIVRIMGFDSDFWEIDDKMAANEYFHKKYD